MKPTDLPTNQSLFIQHLQQHRGDKSAQKNHGGHKFYKINGELMTTK